MTRRQWIADEVSGNRAALVGEHADHLSRVLRARVGQEFDISTGSEIRRGRIVLIEKSRVEFELCERLPVRTALNLSLALAIFKFDRMEWAIEKCTELGVGTIIPLIAARTDVHLASAASKRMQRWQRIAAQAAEQSRRFTAPEIHFPVPLKDLLARPGGLRVVLSESKGERLLRDTLQSPPSGNDVSLAIGAEGGWTDSELQHFREAGWVSASLGNTILRAETAAIAAMAVAASQLAK